MLAPAVRSPGTVPPPVLIVDMSADNRDLYRAYFEGVADLSVKDAATGADALLALERPPQPDIVVFDLVLPDIDGFSFCEQLAAAKVDEPPALVVLTGWPLREQERSLLDALGVSYALQKPCAPQELLEDVQALRARSGETGARAEAARQRAQRLQQKSGMLIERAREIASRLPRPADRLELTSQSLRIRAEYHDMPGLSLTFAQARRLWGLDERSCQQVLQALVGSGFLRQARDGRFYRVS